MSMRISIDKSDPGFVRLAELTSDGYIVNVTLDGREIPGVVTADEEEGIVVAHKYTPEGNIVQYNNTAVYETHRGEVSIRIRRLNDQRVLH